jgi:serine/threonine protein kinase
LRVSQDNVKRFGKYELVGELGRGAMGVVYKARDPLIGRLVALKTVMPGLLSDADLLKRFYREAQSAGRLQHPNIVIIHDLGEENGLPYIAMELVEGDSLQQIIARRLPLPLATKLTIMVQICRGLGYAHQNGVVHRDIKPANILVKPDGTVKVVDFGIVHLADTGMTSSGMILGTVSYMAPEQLRGETVDARSDIFAVGAVMYEMLSYRKTFEGANVTAIMMKIASAEPPPLAQFVPGIPPALDDAVRRCLRKDREERFQSLEDLVFELEPLARQAQREVVESLVDQGRGLLKQRDYGRAEEVLRSALELDSSDESAKSLMAKAQTELRSLRNSPRVKECLRDGQGLLEQGKYVEASQAFEEILRLDSHHGQARDLLAQAREALAKAEEVRRKLDAAKQALSAGEFTLAESEACETLQIDSGQMEAAGLLEKIRAQRAAQQRFAGQPGRSAVSADQPGAPSAAYPVRSGSFGQAAVQPAGPPRTPSTQVRIPGRERPEVPAEVLRPGAAQRPQPSKKRPLMLVAASVLVVALGGVGYMIWRSTGSSSAPSVAPPAKAPAPSSRKAEVTAPPIEPSSPPPAKTSDSTAATEGNDQVSEATSAPAPPQPHQPPHAVPPHPVNLPASTETAPPAVSAGGFGELNVTANIDGAKILLDDKPSAEVAPHVFSGVPAGPHTVTLIKEGFPTVKRQFDVPAGGSVNASLQLSVPMGQLKIVTVPTGADVLIDGKDFGKSPVSVSIAAGAHQWQVTSGTASRQGTIQVPADGFAEKSVEFAQ